MTKKASPRGGRRPGAGRPPVDPSGAKSRHWVRLSPAEVAHVEQLGGGSVNDGIKRLVRESMDQAAKP